MNPGGSLFFSLADAHESADKPEHLRPDEQRQDAQGQQVDEYQGQGHQAGQEQQQGDPHDQQQLGNPAQQQSEHDDNEAEEDEEDEEDEPREPIDFTLRLVDADGAAAELPLSRFSPVQPQLEVQLRKGFLDDPRTESEAVFQSFSFPLEWFRQANPDLDTSRPRRLELVFDRSPEGVVILDSVGFRPPPGL